MITLKLVMTTAGLGRFTAAQVDAGVDLTVTHVGLTAAEFVAAPTLTALPDEFRRLDTVSGESSGDNIVHMTVLDDAALVYTVLGFGLYLADGTLFATYSQPGAIVEKAAGAMLALAIDIAFPQAGVENITFGATNFLNPPATTERKGVVELATLAEARAGDRTRVATPGIVKDLISDALPIGTITLWSGAAPPAGWAICNGQAVDRSDGSGRITTPDLRGRVPVGVSADYALGAAFGSSSATTDDAGAHSHTVEATGTTSAVATGLTIATTPKTDTAGGGTDRTLKTATPAEEPHSHTIDLDGSTSQAAAHHHAVDVIQPSLALHYIMKV